MPTAQRSKADPRHRQESGPWQAVVGANDLGSSRPRRDVQRAGAPVLRVEIVERSDDMNGIIGLPSTAGRAHVLQVRAKSPPRQGLREPCRDPGDLGYLAAIRLA